MKKVLSRLLTGLMIILLTAPSGAVFAMVETAEETAPMVVPDIEMAGFIEENQTIDEEEIEVLEIVNTQDEIIQKQETEQQEKDEDETETPLEYPKIIISELQVNGTCDGREWCIGNNVEFIELHNPHDIDVSLDGWELQRQATGDTSQPSSFVSFEETGLFAGEYALVSLGLTEPSESIIATFSNALSNTAGSLFLVDPNGDVVDMVGWGSAAKSYYGGPAVAPAANQSIQRCIEDGVMHELSPRNNSKEMLVYADLGPTPGAGIECAKPPPINRCMGVVISEIAANVDEQFIELHNTTEHDASLDGCQLQTNRNTRSFVFPDETALEPGGFEAFLIADTGLTLTKTTSGTVYLLSSDGIEIDGVDYSNLSKDTSWALIDGKWLQTYDITPNRANSYQRYLPCEVGYWRNEETGRCNKIAEPATLADCGEGRERNPASGRCRNIPTLRELAPCREGQYRSEETNRCRSIASAAARVLKPCADDQFRNPETNRCKKIASTEDLADCGEGRERNPETNRCRNVRAVQASIADFPVEIVKDSTTSFVAWWAFGGIVVVGLAVGAWEWRREIAKTFKKIASQGKQ